MELLLSILISTLVGCSILILLLALRKRENGFCWKVFQGEMEPSELSRRAQKRLRGVSPYSLTDSENSCDEWIRFLLVIAVLALTGIVILAILMIM